MIGFIDSGVGGLCLMSKCNKLFNEDFVFLCDNKNAPYGNKNVEKLYHITEQNINYLIKHYKITACVIACNTLSYTIGEKLQRKFQIPIILTKMPNEFIKNCKKEILFFGTKNTIKKIQEKYNDYQTLYIKDLPKKKDENLNNLNILEKLLKKYLNDKKYKNVNSIVLCCTHFTCISHIIKKIKTNAVIYDYTDILAKQIASNIQSKASSSFHIVLTDYYYPKYVELKAFYRQLLVDKT